jgi:hypothetical protein
MSKRYIQNKKIIQSKIGEEVVMMDMDSGYYFGLNSVASSIWHKLSVEISLQDLVEKLLQEFKVDKQTCESDTLELLKDMLERNIIREIE